MKKLLTLFALLLALSPVANAQAAKYNCTTAGCTFITDAIGTSPAGAVAATCDFVQCAAGSTTVCNTPALKVNSPVSGSGATAFCSFTGQVFAAGNYAVAARALAADGSPSGYSVPFVFTSSAGAPNVPVNIRSSSPVVP